MHRFSRVLSSGAFRKSRGAPAWNARLIGGASIALGSLAYVTVPATLVCCEEETKKSALPVLVDRLPGSIDLKNCKVTLYQFESCPFCRKARAVLDYARVPYDVVEVNPLTKSETTSFASDYKKVPILVVEDPASLSSFQIRDSKTIIKAVVEATGASVGGSNATTPLPVDVSLNPEKVFDQSAFQGMSVDEAWISWTEGYLLQLVVVNIYGTLEESRETFDYLLTHKDFGWVAREASYWVGSLVMNQVAKSRLKKYTSVQGRHRQAFYDACADLGSAASSGGGFLGGKSPSVADLNAYGVVRSLEGTKTLKNVMQLETGIGFRVWYENMSKVVGESQMRSKVNATHRGGA